MKYRETTGYKYILHEDMQRDIQIFEDAENDYISLHLGRLIIKATYAWDGSSIPLKKYIPFWNFDKYCLIASLVHDALCQLMREDLLPKSYKPTADLIYRDMCVGGGMSYRGADRRYKWLRRFGDAGIKKRENPRGQIKQFPPSK